MSEVDDDYDYGQHDDDDFGPWCRDLDGHKAAHDFCSDHQAMWCRTCNKNGCPQCVDDPHCPDCHCQLFEEHHAWDCAYAGDSDDEE